MAPDASGGRPPAPGSDRRGAEGHPIRRGLIALAVLLIGAAALGFSARPTGERDIRGFQQRDLRGFQQRDLRGFQQRDLRGFQRDLRGFQRDLRGFQRDLRGFQNLGGLSKQNLGGLPKQNLGGLSPVFEVFPAPAPVLPPASACLPDPDTRPRIALIIDDLGYNRRMAERFVLLHPAITLSVLPRSPHGAAIARSARSRGREIMLHLPMEPLEYPAVDPGPGALTVAMAPAEIRQTLTDHLDAIPFVTGVNNHMGSRLTTLAAPMYEILSVLKGRHLFFIDSRTSENSLAGRTARLLQVPFARRDVFLDHDPAPSAIRAQIRLLIRISRLHGEAVGIGHPHESTLQVLTAELPTLTDTADLVTASRLVHTSG